MSSGREPRRLSLPFFVTNLFEKYCVKNSGFMQLIDLYRKVFSFLRENEAMNVDGFDTGSSGLEFGRLLLWIVFGICLLVVLAWLFRLWRFPRQKSL